MMNRFKAKPWLLSIVAGTMLAATTLAASVWGSLSVLSFAQDHFSWPTEQHLRLLTYGLVGWISLVPAAIAICMPLGFALKQSTAVQGLVAGIIAVIVWLAVYDWSGELPSVLYYSEILGVVVLSIGFTVLGGVIGRLRKNESTDP
jgi:hypothetical protein